MSILTKTTGNRSLDVDLSRLNGRISSLEAAIKALKVGPVSPTNSVQQLVSAPPVDVGFDNPMTAAGEIIVGGAGGLPTALPVGADSKVLTVLGQTPVWQPNIGAKGDPGIFVIGADGIDGEDGPRGFPGVQGVQGVTGPAGPVAVGMDGMDGDEGPIGPIGPVGPQGIQGLVGVTGPQGAIGMGLDGADGSDGWPVPGPAGPKGDTGSSSVTVGTYAARPAAGNSGALYFCTDNGVLYTDSGTVWRRCGLAAGGDVPTFTTDTNAPTIATLYGTEQMTCTGSGGEKWYGRYIAAPSRPYTITARITPGKALEWANYMTYGLYFSDGTKLWTACLQRNGTQGCVANVRKLSNSTTFSAGTTVIVEFTAILGDYAEFIQITDDGTSITFSVSFNGIHWEQIFTELRGAFLSTGPTRVGWGMNLINGATATTSLLSWLQT